MSYFNTASKGIKLVEKVFMIIVTVSIAFKYTIDYNATVDLLVAGFLLSLFYFPFGFYFLGKPLITSIPFGIVYYRDKFDCADISFLIISKNITCAQQA